MRRNAIAFVLPLAMTGALAAGCGQAPSSETTDETSPNERRFLSVGTAPPGGAFFVVGGAIAEVLNNEADPAYGWEVTAEATKGSQENIRRLVSGELDVGVSNAAVTYFAVRGEAGWDRAYPVKAIMTLAPNVAMFVTPHSSGIDRMEGLRGKRVVVGVAGAGMQYFIRPLLEAHGITYDDFTPLNNTQSGAVDMLADGSAAAAFLGGAIPTASIVQASTSQDVLLIPLEPDAREKAAESYPFFEPKTIPADTYRGQSAPYDGLNVGSMHLITASDADEDMVYRITRTIYESRAKVAEKHPAGRAINPANVIVDTGTEFHPGAIRFYQEIDIWPNDDASSEQ